MPENNMTKQQLIDALASKYTKVGIETDWQTIKTIIGIDIIAIPIWEKESEAMWENNILVCKDGNDYFWKNGEPKSGNTIFTQRLQGFLNSKITDGTVKFATIKESNNDIKKGTLTAVMPDKSTKTLLVFETAPNNFTYEAIA